ncbi:formate dehydrogenase accessory sulfurtransferase FdhD [Halpernia frigidisoli]|uniref:Sulfur carrier protein FdhD n=1 Tax=Halpernia frigidisoli TaxID=1125876 RepID=A0A1I3FRP7_9FLAO|nr:formate dehydrogenase accessory sulfurtransferase FdhD [Halpernia frigidisoli]SFI13895.1 FdhD protein [Halpernia frigidisoli]
MIKEFKINKVVGFGKENFSKNDNLAIEEPLEISLKIASKTGIHPLSVTMRTPGNDRDLAIGFLFTEGIINQKSNLSGKISAQVEENKLIVEFSSEFNPDLQKLKRNFYTTSSCGVCGKESIEAIKQVCKIPILKPETSVKMETLFSLTEKLLNVQKTFESTGGIHASALFDLEGNLINYREDVGRHNALDKLIGSELLKYENEDFSLKNRIVLLSGRASFELIQKCAMAGVPIICAIGAPSSLAVETAENFGITLVGFLKNGNANIYCGADKLDLNLENEN